MLTFKDYLAEENLQEKYLNMLPGDEAEKKKHAQEVFDILTKSYESQGGLKSGGFENPQSMVDNIPFWKVHKNGSGQITHVILYKDKLGRKPVALGTNGTKEGKNWLAHTMKRELGRGHMEVSGNALNFYKRSVGPILPDAHTREQVRQMYPDEEIRDPDPNDPEVLAHPELANHFYQRKLGDGEWHTKLSAGTVGNKITPKLK